jgi:hypothetical protein
VPEPGTGARRRRTSSAVCATGTSTYAPNQIRACGVARSNAARCGSDASSSSPVNSAVTGTISRTDTQRRATTAAPSSAAPDRYTAPKNAACNGGTGQDSACWMSAGANSPKKAIQPAASALST